jgi:hypothetical protein
MKIKNVVQTRAACPSQWDAMTEDNRSVYIRYRWGNFSVEVCEEIGFHEYGNGDWVFIFDQEIGNSLDGYMTDEQMLEIIDQIVTVQDCGFD